jgi:hypothetical protein
VTSKVSNFYKCYNKILSCPERDLNSIPQRINAFIYLTTGILTGMKFKFRFILEQLLPLTVN